MIARFRVCQKWIFSIVALVICTHFLLQLWHIKGHNKWNVPVEPSIGSQRYVAQCFAVPRSDAVDINSVAIWDELLKKPGQYEQYKNGLNNIFDAPLPTMEKDKLEKVKIILVPNAHVDPGWLKTFAEYSQVTNTILDNVVDFLSTEPKMTFMWSESSFLDMWLKQASEERKGKLKSILSTNQFEITNGAWVMTDEASAHYWSLIDNLIEGHQFLQEQLSVKPLVSWSCDPFGHSQTVPYLYRRANISRIAINRIHKVTKVHMALAKEFDFVWRQMWDNTGENDVLTTILRTTTYDFKESCGANVATCCKFDFTGAAGSCSTGPVTPNNVKPLADLMQKNYRNLVASARFNVVFLPIGGDFHYTQVESLRQQFESYQMLFKEINSHPTWNMEVGFGSLSEYFNELEIRSDGKMPKFSGDFFPYTLNGNTIWSGYFSSRPFYKLMDRKLHAALRSADILWSFVRSKASAEVRTTVAQQLSEVHKTMSLFQHHDAITGTSKSLVMQDYGKMLFAGMQLAHKITETSVGLLALAKNPSPTHKTRHVYHTNEGQSDPLSPPQRKIIHLLKDKEKFEVLVHNSLPYKSQRLIRLLLDTPHVKLLDYNRNDVKLQVNPTFSLYSGLLNVTKPTYEVVFIAQLPPLAVISYTLSTTAEATGPKLESVFGKGQLLNEISSKFPVKGIPTAGITFVHGYLQTTHDSVTGLLTSVKVGAEPIETLSVSFWNYGVSASPGAYMFGPIRSAKIWETSHTSYLCFNGPLVSECWTLLNHLFHRVIITHHLEEIHFENEIDLSSVKDSTELVFRIESSLLKDEFYTDSMGFQNIRRKYRSQLQIAENYYPMASNVFFENEFKRITILAGQPHGVTVRQGVVEIMLERKTQTDDGAGLNENLSDNVPVTSRFSLLIEHKKIQPISTTGSDSMALLSRSASLSLLALLYQPLVLTSTSIIKSQVEKLDFRPLSVPFPCNFQLINIRPLTRGGEQSQSLLILHRVGVDCDISEDKSELRCDSGTDLTSVLNKLLVALDVRLVKATSLSGLYDLETVWENGIFNKNMDISVMNIQSFKLYY